MQNTYLVNSLLTFSAITATTFIERGNVFLLRKKVTYIFIIYCIHGIFIPGFFFCAASGQIQLFKKILTICFLYKENPFPNVSGKFKIGRNRLHVQKGKKLMGPK